MPATRIRGKSAVHSHVAIGVGGPLLVQTLMGHPHPVDHNSQTFNLTNHPLLKIESVVPTVGLPQHNHHPHNNNTNARHSRMIRRSHSTVSSAYLRKVADPRSRTVAALNRITNSSNTEQGSCNDGNEEDEEKTANAFPRIKRTRKDREKFPDRINLDRKGLTAIPLIDDEPQLRLLSLQHNLINQFHVPEITEEVEEEVPSNAAPAESNPGVDRNRQQVENGFSLQSKNSHRPIIAYNLSRHRLVTGNGMLYHNPPPPPLSNGSTSSSSSTNTPSILINGIPNYYCPRSMANVKSLQALNINQKLILKKNPYVQSLYQSSVLGIYNHHHHPHKSNGKSVSDSGIGSSGSDNNNNNQNSSSSGSLLNCPSRVIQCRYGDTLHNLVFLDLYDNQIEKIGNLEGLKSLTVLLLGKNRIVDIAGIVGLKNSLRVLDLHGNRITNISHKICRLQELKSLNLAGNTLRQIHAGDLAGLQNLRELNLKRNRIKRLSGFEDLQHLERLWLCNNDIHKVEDMSCIAKAINLKEITVENNPVSLAGDCCSFLVSYLPNLMLLSQMHVTDQVKRAAMAWRKSKETTDVAFVSISSEVGQSIRREEVISNARTNWELLRSQPQFSTGNGKRKTPPVMIQERQEKELHGTAVLVQTKVIPKLEQTIHLITNSQDSNESIKEVVTENPATISLCSPITNEVDVFRLPPISDPSMHLENLTPKIVKTQMASVEDSLGANVDSTSIFSGTSSGNSSRSPSSCRSSGPGNSASELEDFKGEVDGPVDVQEKVVEQKIVVPEDEEGGDGVRVEFNGKGKSDKLKGSVKSPPSRATEDLKMPMIKISENDYPLDNRSTISVSSSLRAEHSGTGQAEEVGSTTLRSMRNRCSTSRKLLPPTNPSNLSVHRAQTAKLSPSSSSSLVLVNNNNSKGSSSANTSPGNNAANQPLPSAKSHAIDREREQGGDYLIEICGRYLNVYGVGALKFVDKQWNVQKAGDVHTVKFSYINFNNICVILGKIKSRFPNAENFCFRETNITCLGQLNSLAELQGFQSIVVEADGNLISTKKWRSYAIFRLSHWGLKQINGQDITETEMEEAERLYGQLPDLVLWSLPESLLAPLLSRLRLEEPCQASRLSAKDWLMQAETSLKCVVGKEALQWRKSPTGNVNGNQPFDEQSVRIKGQQCFTQMMDNTCNAVDKLDKLETLWPTMLTEMIRSTLIDYSQLDTYVKNLQKSLPI